MVKYGCTEGRHGNPSLASNVPGRFVEGYRSYINGSLVGPPPDRIDAEIFINTDKKSDKGKEGVSLVVGILTYFATMEGVVMYQPDQESDLVKTLTSNAESPDNSTTPKGADQISVIECAWTAVSGGTTTELHDGKPIAVNIKIRIKEVKEMKDVADSDPVVFNWVEDTEGEEPKKSKKRPA
ncbi:hypothetical protein BD410DRAFT_796477 [Rickenella mellea]|uniref:Uncharacterized protein n=1 Tax=Rickenella mellea TaxID=50990 RepID=A0A4Y7PIR4_9AGAM|nr:hypothetical protein BD410DRAFT_796477 [Rickenella mellea]